MFYKYFFCTRSDWAGVFLTTVGWASKLIHFFGPEFGRSTVLGAVDPACRIVREFSGPNRKESQSKPGKFLHL